MATQMGLEPTTSAVTARCVGSERRALILKRRLETCGTVPSEGKIEGKNTGGSGLADCSGSAWVAFIPLLFAAYTAFLAITEWFRPDSVPYGDRPPAQDATDFQLAFGYTRESALRGYRTGAPILTVIFSAIGIALIGSTFQTCGGLGFSVAIGLKYWSFLPLEIVICAALILYFVRGIQRKRQTILIALGLIFAFTGSEATAFHTGTVADTWGTIAFTTFLAFAMMAWRWRVWS